MESQFDILIIGAGVVGACIAWELSHYRISTAMVEREVDVSFWTSKANSGIIHVGFHASPGTLKARLVVEGNRQFDRLSEELEFPFERRGELVVAFSEEEVRVLQNLYLSGTKNNVQHLGLLGRERTLEMEPSLNPDLLGALYAPTAGIVGPDEYCFALVENAAANGVELFLGERVVWSATARTSPRPRCWRRHQEGACHPGRPEVCMQGRRTGRAVCRPVPERFRY